MGTSSSSSWSLFRAEPYRLLFPIGWLWGVVATAHWIALRVGWTHDYGLLYHGYLQTLGFGGCFAAGFLLTALPFFLSARPADSWELILAVLLAAGIGGAALAGRLFLSVAAFLLLVALIASFVLRRYNRRTGAPPPLTYVACAMVHGLAGAALALAPPAGFPRIGDRLIEQGFLLCLMLGIGSFLGARFLGTFQPPAFLFRSKPGRPPASPMVAMQRVFLLGGVLLFASFWIEEGLSPLAGKLLRAAVVSFQFLAFARIHRTPQPALWSTHVLRASYWMVIAGLWLAALLPRQEIVWMHVTFIGGIGLMTLVIGFRVVTNHGGLEAWWITAKGLLATFGAGAGLALALRLVAPFRPTQYTTWLAVAAGAWLFALAAWGVWMLPRITPRHRPSTQSS